MSGWDLSAQAALLSRGVSANGAGWFGPGPLLPPMAPEQFGWGRVLDYSQATNATIQPKAVDQGLTYRQCRNLAESSDYVATAIQTVLDRLCAAEGRVVDVGGDPRKPSAKADAVNAWAQAMDGITPLSDFLQAAAYDMCVVDAATAYVDKSVPGKPTAYTVDGATIVAHLDERGRVASFGQVIKGQIAHEYRRDELIWMPKNRRPHKVYGFSFVEQVKTTISISLMRMSRQADWFTVGNIPDVLIEAPDGWTPQQVKDVNSNWDKMMAGISGKGKARYVPSGSKVTQIDRNPIAGEFDEWLIRVICYAFSLPPTAFVKQINRTTSETMQDASISEGHAAIMRWAANFLTAVITSAWGPGYRWEWNLAQPSKEDTIKLLVAGLLKPSAAIRLGYAEDEIAETPKPVAPAPAPAPAPAEDGKPGKPADESGEDRQENADCCDHHEHVENADVTPTQWEADLAAVVQEYLDVLRERGVAAAEEIFHGREAEFDGSAPKGLRFRVRVQQILEDSALGGAASAASTTPRVPENMGTVTAAAKAYAKERAAEMVGMRMTADGLVPNPDSAWQISDMARESIKKRVEQAFEQKLTPAKLSELVSQDQAFSPRRALNIARTETATAQEAGSFAYYKAAGVPKKKWSDQDGCPICQANAAQAPIPMDKPFQSGHMTGPAHPSCRCTIIPVEDENA